jgi:hypothetical protein
VVWPCVYVSVCERERGYAVCDMWYVCVRVCVKERGYACVCERVCVCVCESERV